MKKNLTELVFILDRSGSMQGLEGDTIGGRRKSGDDRWIKRTRDGDHTSVPCLCLSSKIFAHRGHFLYSYIISQK